VPPVVAPRSDPLAVEVLGGTQPVSSAVGERGTDTEAKHSNSHLALKCANRNMLRNLSVCESVWVGGSTLSPVLDHPRAAPGAPIMRHNVHFGVSKCTSLCIPIHTPARHTITVYPISVDRMTGLWAAVQSAGAGFGRGAGAPGTCDVHVASAAGRRRSRQCAVMSQHPCRVTKRRDTSHSSLLTQRAKL
jgi:hypothetical protein